MGVGKTIVESVTGVRTVKDVKNILDKGVIEGTRTNIREQQKESAELTDATGKFLSKAGKSLEDSAEKINSSVKTDEEPEKERSVGKIIFESVTGIGLVKDGIEILDKGPIEGIKASVKKYQKDSAKLADAAGKRLSKAGKSLEDSAKKTVDSIKIYEAAQKERKEKS